MIAFAKLPTFILLLISFSTLSAQNNGVGINTDNTDPDPSALLDVKSTTKGVLVPRMNTTQREAISNAATGLLVFDISTESFWFKGASGWVELVSGQNNAYSLPDTAGTSGQVLQADANGNATWATPQSGVPVGTILAFGGPTLPTGFLACNGQSVDRNTYPDLFEAIGTSWGGNGIPDFNLPDLRGQFLRGWDNGAAIDPEAGNRRDVTLTNVIGDVVGSYQNHALQQHTHDYTRNSTTYTASSGNSAVLRQTATAATTGASANTSSETRPRNASVYYIIKY